jgi:RHS repeat-associated protein
MFARFTFRKINSAVSRLSSWVSKSNTLSKSGANGNKRRPFKTRRLGKSALHKFPRNKRVLFAILLLASSAAALASIGVRRVVRPEPSLAHVNAASAAGGAVKAYEPPATTNPPLTKRREYVYAGSRLIMSEEKTCVPTLSPASASLPQVGGTGFFDVSTLTECVWSATPSASWITITSGASGVGAGRVHFSVAANSGAQRSGTITVNGQAFNITQALNPASCSYSLNIPGKQFSENGGGDSFNLTTGEGCPWSASSNASWLTVAQPTSGNGTATINYSVAANSGPLRIGEITVGGRKFTVTQDPNPASCTFAFSPGSRLVGVGGENGVFFNVTTGAGCRWNAENNNGWITITGGGANNNGNGMVTFNVQANNGGSRTGAISVRGQDFTVTQCGYVVSPTSASFNGGGGTGSITVSAVAGCPWSATSDVEWVTITSGANGVGNGSVNYSVDGISDSCSFGRAGHITVAGRPVLIGQSNIVQPCIINPACCEGSAMGAEARGLTARYFSNATLSGRPTLQRIDPVVNFDWAGASPDKLLPANDFSARWNAQLAAPSSEAYTFFLYSDGGVRLWVNNRLVIDRWQPPFEPLTQSAPVDLKAGAKADIRVEYYNAGRGGVVYLLWSSASTPRQIIPRRYLYPEAATNGSTPADTNKQTGMLLPPGSDACPKAARPQPSAPSGWMAIPHSRAGLVLSIACGVSAILLGTRWRQARSLFTAATGVVSRLQDQIALRLGEIFRIAATASDKLQFVVAYGKKLFTGIWDKLNVVGFGKRLLAGALDKLRFVGHFLAALLPTFQVSSHVGAVIRLGKRKLAELLPERVRNIAWQALALWRSSGLARLKPILRRALTIALIVRLAAPLTTAETAGLVRAAQTAWREARAYVGAIANRPFNMAPVRRSGMVASAAAQAEQVDELQVCPKRLVMFVGERYTLTPVALAVNPLDGSKKVVHGAGMSWSSLSNDVAEVSSFGQVEAMAVGTTDVVVQCGAASKHIPVEVRSGRRDVSSNQQADIDPTNDCAAEQSFAYTPQSAASAQQNLLEDEDELDWDPQPAPNSLAAHFRNAVGNPRFTATSQGSGGVPTSAQLGSYSYQFKAPVVTAGGRGMTADIGMTLNSRVWNNDNGKLTFNYVGAFPAPGWTMGYGKIIRNYNATAFGDHSGVGIGNSPGDYLLVADDGTRTPLNAIYEATTDRWFHESKEGSFLRFDPRSGEMRRPDGSRTVYSSVNGCLLPTAMIGANGGVITMTYRDYCEGAGCTRVFRHRTALSAVRDTLGRYFTFHYYADGDYPAAAGRPAGELAAIKAPDKDGVQQEVIRVEYRSVTLKYNFGGAVVDAPVNNSQIQVVWRIYYPQTGRGFLLLDYSSYGMPRKISSRMGMTGAGGVVTDGVETAYTTYNYTTMDPTDPYDRNQEGSLNDSPQFTLRGEWWQGKTSAAGAPTADPTMYDYSRTMVGSAEVTTIKHLGRDYEEVTATETNGLQIVSFGKVLSVERRNSETGSTLGKHVFTYTFTPDFTVEIERLETIDEDGKGTLVRFGFGPYGRVTDRYECGYKQGDDYQVRRRIHYVYLDDTDHVAARFLRLVSRTSIYDANNNNNDDDDVLKAKIEAEYDNYAEPRQMKSYGLNSSLYPPNHDAAYDQNKVIRGNVTAVKTFSSINPEVAATRRVRYDIFGNVVEVDANCCAVKSFSFSGLTAYSRPDRARSGGETGLFMETTYEYNYFTGLVDNETNPDGLRTLYDYDRALRLNNVTKEATGAMVETEFQDDNGNDLLSHVGKAIYDDQGEQKTINSKQWFDGSWRVLREGTGTGDAPDSYDTTATVYDDWGRVSKRSNPYLGDASGIPQEGVTQYWTENTYDELSRVKKVTLPGAQTIEATYKGATATSGATVIVTDTVGRKRMSESDGMGRLVKMTEQNPANGALEWVTRYSYNALDNLTQVDQGGQLRTFEYDDKGRLVRETTPEGGPIDYTYTDFDAIKTSRDARGVLTTYTYGDLNLLTSVKYDTTSAPGVATTEEVKFTYKNAPRGKGQIATIMDGAGSESYVYDDVGRLQSCTREIDGVSYQKRYEYNAAGHVTLMTYPSGKRVKVGYDARGRLSDLQSVDDSGNMLEHYLSEINYRADGQISRQKLGNGATENFGYSDDRMQLTSQTVTKGGATLLSLNYVYAAVAGQMGSQSKAGNSGQLVSVNGTVSGQNRNQTFTYDNVGRLVTATGWGAWARKFDYDPYGNRTAVWDAVSGGNLLQNTVISKVGEIKTNRIESVNATAFNYDASGNVTNDGVRTYTYDAVNRIVSASEPSSESYRYDAGNRRVKKVAGGVVTHYIWEGNQVIAKYEHGGSSESATGTRYYHPDCLSTRVITDGAGNVKGTMDHLPFGEETGGSDERDKRKFTTYEQDGTGLYYAVNRFYSPQHGRFAQVDPLGMGATDPTNPQSLNMYSYVLNDPANLTDPSGLVIPIIIIIASAAIGGLSSAAASAYFQAQKGEINWKTVGVAFVVGAAAGAVSPFLVVAAAEAGTSIVVSQMLLGVSSNLAQTTLTGLVNWDAPTVDDLLWSGFTGAAGGVISGALVGSGFSTMAQDPGVRGFAMQQLVGVSFGSAVRGAVGGAVTNTNTPEWFPFGSGAAGGTSGNFNVNLDNLGLTGDAFSWLGMSMLPSVDGGYGTFRGPWDSTNLFKPGSRFYFPTGGVGGGGGNGSGGSGVTCSYNGVPQRCTPTGH